MLLDVPPWHGGRATFGPMKGPGYAAVVKQMQVLFGLTIGMGFIYVVFL